MKVLRRSLACWASIAILAAIGSARGAEFNETFEGYAVGSNLHGQGGWKGWDNDPAGGALISDAAFLGGTRAVAIAGSSDLVHEFSGVLGGVWTLQIDQFVPSDAAGESFLILLNKYRDGGVADFDNWSSQVGVYPSVGQVKSDFNGDGNGIVAPLKKGSWATWAFTLDLERNEVWEYYDGKLLVVQPWQSGGANALAAIDLYGNNSSTVYYDNLRVSKVPEPSVLSLGVVAALSFLIVGRGRR